MDKMMPLYDIRCFSSAKKREKVNEWSLSHSDFIKKDRPVPISFNPSFCIPVLSRNGFVKDNLT